MITCDLCKGSVKLIVPGHGGARYHTWVESNGYDYERCSAPCAIQAEDVLDTMRRDALQLATKQLMALRKEQSILKQKVKQLSLHRNTIRVTKNAFIIHRQYGKVRDIIK